jgi:Domain of unknown function DUF11
MNRRPVGDERDMRPHRLILALTAAMAIAIPAVPAEAATSADLATTMSQPGGRIFMGGQWYYEVMVGYTTFNTTVTNNGPDTASNVQLTDNWSGAFGRFQYANATTSGGAPSPSCTTPTLGAVGKPVICTISSLARGQSVTLSLTVKPASLGGRMGLTNSARASSPTPDPNTANNSAQSTVIVMP